MKFILVSLALWFTSCAHDELPSMRGDTLAPGIVSMEPLVERTANAEPWAPSLLYPTLSAAPAESETPTLSARAAGPMQATAWLWFRAYQSTLSRVDGTTCRFRPTCSGFGIEAIQQHGLLGLPMTFGRLHKSHAAEKHYPMTNPPFLADPVSNYGFTARRPRLDDFAAYDDEAHAWYQHVRATRRVR